jgi:hypothetical protein
MATSEFEAGELDKRGPRMPCEEFEVGVLDEQKSGFTVRGMWHIRKQLEALSIAASEENRGVVGYFDMVFEGYTYGKHKLDIHITAWGAAEHAPPRPN